MCEKSIHSQLTASVCFSWCCIKLCWNTWKWVKCSGKKDLLVESSCRVPSLWNCMIKTEKRQKWGVQQNNSFSTGTMEQFQTRPQNQVLTQRLCDCEVLDNEMSSQNGSALHQEQGKIIAVSRCDFPLLGLHNCVLCHSFISLQIRTNNVRRAARRSRAESD